jgi:hypothetical protein
VEQKHSKGIIVNILFCGQRDYKDYNFILHVMKEALKKHDIDDLLIIHGAAPGADTLAENAAKKLQIDYRGFPARWDYWREQGNVKAAGAIRNKRMLDIGVPELVLAFYHDYENSKGTRNMIEQAKKYDVPCKEFWNRKML